MQRVGHAVVQRVEVLPEVGRERELLRDQVEYVLLGLGVAQVGVQEVLAGALAASCRSFTRNARIDCTMFGRTARRDKVISAGLSMVVVIIISSGRFGAPPRSFSSLMAQSV
jgi:hypothetical protein